MKEEVIGIMGAMPQEIDGIISLMQNRKTIESGMRVFHTGELNGKKVVAVFSRWGKVAAATTVTTLINKFQISKLIFTGVAGALQPHLNIGDFVIAKRLIQHDVDARPLFKQNEIPLIGKTYFNCDNGLLLNVEKAIVSVINQGKSHRHLEEKIAKVFFGDIASGDQFFSSSKQKESVLSILPDALCVEMEGAAVAQVCYEYQIPFVVVRIISDAADDNAVADFELFVSEVVENYTKPVFLELFKQ